MRFSTIKIRLIALFFGITFLISAQTKPTQQWLDQKFSMFIHFGLYSAYGGVYEGKPIERGYSEQIQTFAGIFSDWYAEKANEFNPVKWNADSIVALAKSAGMKSIVLTAKHHDGFCMYHSLYTDFNIVEATPYGKDVLKSLSDACARGGIDFGVYFSLIDWHFPQAYPYSSHNADPITPEHHQYNLKQVEEIMIRYGKISEIWFDMGSLTLNQSKELYALVNRLQPQCMISGRLGNNLVDFAVMADNAYPDYKLSVPWQTAASLFDETWGYRSWQKRGSTTEKTAEKISSLIKVISHGGNYLLNIGPRGDGSVVEFERDVLLGMGKWLKNNAEAVYGTKANPFSHALEWGDITTKDENLYLFVRKEYFGKDIELSGFKGIISDIIRLDNREKCQFFPPKIIGKPYYIRLPQWDENISYIVLKVTFKNGFTISPATVSSRFLTAQNATPEFGFSSLNYYAGYKSLTAYNWAFSSRKTAVSPILSFTENEKNRKIKLIIDDKEQIIPLNSEKYIQKRISGKSVEWGSLFTKLGRGLFGNVAEEHQPFVNPETSGWTQLDDFDYEATHSLRCSPRRSILLLQEITSTQEQRVAVEVACGNAMYIILNGEYVTAHFSPDRIPYQKEIVILPLKKGKNQLILKFYNGFEKELKYGLKPLWQWKEFVQTLPSTPLKPGEQHTLSVRDAEPASLVSPLRLQNIQIQFK